MIKIHNLLTVLIPTKNRYHFLKKNILFHKNDLNTQFIILDSSDDNLQNKFDEKLIINKNFKYYKLNSSTNFHEKISFGIKLIETEFFVIQPDDDFIDTTVSKNLIIHNKQPKKIDFIQSKRIDVYNYLIYKKFFLERSPLKYLEPEKINFRLSKILDPSNPWNGLYDIHRTEFFTDCWNVTKKIVNNFDQKSLSVILEVVKNIKSAPTIYDKIYMCINHMHEENWGKTESNGFAMKNWLNSEERLNSNRKLKIYMEENIDNYGEIFFERYLYFQYSRCKNIINSKNIPNFIKKDSKENIKYFKDPIINKGSFIKHFIKFIIILLLRIVLFFKYRNNFLLKCINYF